MKKPIPLSKFRPGMMPLYNQKKISFPKRVNAPEYRRRVGHIPLWQIFQWGQHPIYYWWPPKIYDRSLWFKTVWDNGIDAKYFENDALIMRRYGYDRDI